MAKRGRPVSEVNNEPILVYTKRFEDIDGTTYIWNWDKTINPNAPISVSINDPRFNVTDKLLREFASIEKKYESKPGQRKLRISKVDNKRLEELKIQIENEHYKYYPEDEPKIHKNKTKKV